MSLRTFQLNNEYVNNNRHNSDFKKHIKKCTARKRRRAKYSDDARLKAYTKLYGC